MREKKIISIVGPTASGKSDLAISIAEKYKLSIINSDSKLLYKGLNIGTAKPSIEELNKTKHYMVNILQPDESSNLLWFLENCRRIIEKLDLSLIHI